MKYIILSKCGAAPCWGRKVMPLKNNNPKHTHRLQEIEKLFNNRIDCYILTHAFVKKIQCGDAFQTLAQSVNSNINAQIS